MKQFINNLSFVEFLYFLKKNKRIHIPNTSLNDDYKRKINKKFTKKNIALHILNEKIKFPYYKNLGIKLSNLFALNELILFSYYFFNRGDYKYFLDIGANIGIHSIIASKIDFKVMSFEPDPLHFQELKKNLRINKIYNSKIFNLGIFKKKSKKFFIQVINNTTANHIEGLKENLYGKIKKITINTANINSFLKNSNTLIKIDAEGSEIEILKSININKFNKHDIIMEINSINNAASVFSLCKKKKINIFSQKNLWKKSINIADIPTHHSEGFIFLSKKNQMPW